MLLQTHDLWLCNPVTKPQRRHSIQMGDDERGGGGGINNATEASNQSCCHL